MKVNFLINKTTGEFAEITSIAGTSYVFTSELPLMPLQTIESPDIILKYLSETFEIDLSEYEVRGFDIIESKIVDNIITKSGRYVNDLMFSINGVNSSIGNDKYFTLINIDAKRLKNIIKELRKLFTKK